MGQSLKNILDETLINALPDSLKRAIDKAISLGGDIETVRSLARDSANKAGGAPTVLAAIDAYIESRKLEPRRGA